MENLEEIAAKEKAWREGVLEKHVQAFPERQPEFRSGGGDFPYKAVYTPLDLEEVGFDYSKDIGFPGEYPYTRGLTPNGYRSNFWVMSQISGYGSGEHANQRWRMLLDQGLTGFLVEFDLPTQVGLDSDDPSASGEVSRVGVAIDTLDDFERAFDLPYEKIHHIYFITSAVCFVIMAMMIATLEKKGVSPQSFNVTLQNFIPREFACRGMYVFPPEPSLKLAADVIEYCAKNYPGWAAISGIGCHGSCAASPVKGNAFILSGVLDHIDAVLKRGVDIDQVAPTMSVLTAGGEHFFDHIACMRATKKVWARLMRERYGAKDPRSWQLRILMPSGGGGAPPTRQQPLNNITRYAMGMLSSVLAGVHQLSTPLYDEGHAIPSEDAVRVGACAHQIIARETGAADVADPLAGSYFVEYLTKQYEDAILAEIDKIQEMGGCMKAIEAKYFQNDLAKIYYNYQSGLDSGAQPVVGVNINRLEGEEERDIGIFRIEPWMEQYQIERLNKVRRERDSSQVRRALARLEEAARDNVNVLPATIEAVKAYATIGEIRKTLVPIYGEFKEDWTRL